MVKCPAFPKDKTTSSTSECYTNALSDRIGISGDIPKDWHGKKVLIDGMEFETTPVYDLPNQIAIIGSGGDLGQEIIFV